MLHFDTYLFIMHSDIILLYMPSPRLVPVRLAVIIFKQILYLNFRLHIYFPPQSSRWNHPDERICKVPRCETLLRI